MVDFFHRKNRDGSTSNVPISSPQPRVTNPFSSPASPQGSMISSPPQYAPPQPNPYMMYNAPIGPMPPGAGQPAMLPPNRDAVQKAMAELFNANEAQREDLYKLHTMVLEAFTRIKASPETMARVKRQVQSTENSINSFQKDLMGITVDNYEQILGSRDWMNGLYVEEDSFLALQNELSFIGQKLSSKQNPADKLFYQAARYAKELAKLSRKMEDDTNVALFGVPARAQSDQ